jgi:methenyltetrahydrofolate cyclohydrolase
MCLRITKNKKNYLQYAERYAPALAELEQRADQFYKLIHKDAEAFTEVMFAYKVPKDDPDRDEILQKALVHATAAPAETARTAVSTLKVIKDLQPIIHSSVMSDFEVAVQMLGAAVRAAIANMKINLQSLKDQTVRKRFEDEIANFEQEI